MRKQLKIGSAVLVLLLVAGFGFSWWLHGRYIETTDDAYLQSDISIIAPKIAGYVKSVAVAENQHVRAGDTLVVIDDQDFAPELERATAERAAQKALVDSITSQMLLQLSRIDSAEADVKGAEADLAFAQSDLSRYRDLTRSGAASKQKFETAEQSGQKASAGLDKAKATLASEQRQAAVLEAQKAQAEAALKQAIANETLRRNDLNNTVIRAPVDGTVGNKGVEIGQYVKAGTQLFALIPDRDIYIVANFKETQIRRMEPGQPVEVSVDAFPSEHVTGKLESFAPASGAQFSLLPPENATGNFTKVVQRIPVRIALPIDDPLTRKLRPGLSVVASVDTRPGDDAGATTRTADGAAR